MMKNNFRFNQQVWNHASVSYVPLLAEQGIKYNVSGDDKRGGLLVGDPASSSIWNVLWLLVSIKGGSNIIHTDTARLNVMKDLRAMNLLVKNDIKDQDFLFWSCCTTNKLRFEYLATWLQNGLKTYKHKDYPIFHSIIKNRSATFGSFPTFLEVSLQRYPQDAGLLLQKDHRGKTACEYAFDIYGK